MGTSSTVLLIVGHVTFDIYYIISLALYISCSSDFTMKKRLPHTVNLISLMIYSTANFGFYILYQKMGIVPPGNPLLITFLKTFFKIISSTAHLLLILRCANLLLKYYSSFEKTTILSKIAKIRKLRRSSFYIVFSTCYIIALLACFIPFLLKGSNSHYEAFSAGFFITQRVVFTALIIIVLFLSYSTHDELGIRTEFMLLSFVWSAFLVIYIIIACMKKYSSGGFIKDNFDFIYKLLKIVLSDFVTIFIILNYPVYFLKFRRKTPKLNKKASIETLKAELLKVFEEEKELSKLKSAAIGLFSLESVLFPVEVLKLKKSTGNIEREAMHIYNKYIKDNAIDQINIKFSTKKVIEEDLNIRARQIKRSLSRRRVQVSGEDYETVNSNKSISPEIFDKAFDECMSLIITNIWKSYKNL